MRRTCVVVALAAMTAGCYRYVPARAGAVPPGAEVRVRLSTEAMERLARLPGYGMQAVEGVLVDWSQQVVVAAPVPEIPGAPARDLRRRIELAPDEVLAIEVRERDTTRTAVLAGGALAVVTVALLAAFTGTFGGYDVPGPPEQEEGLTMATWLRIFP